MNSASELRLSATPKLLMGVRVCGVGPTTQINVYVRDINYGRSKWSNSCSHHMLYQGN